MYKTVVQRTYLYKPLLTNIQNHRNLSSNASIRCLFLSTCSHLKLLKLNRQCKIHRQNSFFSITCRSVRFYSSGLPDHVKLTLPALSPTMETGTIVSWQKNIGDRVNEGDLLAEIETDKAVMGWDTSEEGYMARIFVEAGTKNIPIGKLLCILVSDEKDVPIFKDIDSASLESSTTSQPVAAAPPPPPSPPQQTAVHHPPISTPITAPSSTPQRVKASPLAKKMAAEQGLSLAGVSGSGPAGRIRSVDLSGAGTMAAVSPSIGVSPPASSQIYTDIPLTNMRQVIAKRLTQSKQTIPHYYLSVDIKMDRISELRAFLNERLKNENVKLSYNDFIIKASALACKKVPEANSSWMGEFVRQYQSVDVSVAVSTDGGLITPIIFSADSKGLRNINTEVKELSEKARNGKLAPHEFQGGTFTVSNLGMFGVKNFSAVINPPQVCILAVGCTEKMVIPDEPKIQGYRVCDMMSVTLSCDHRVVDGAVGAQWLAEFRGLLESPEKMIL